MNREFKFRAWDSSENKMLTTFHITSMGIAWRSTDNAEENYSESIDFPIMQFTGLRDKKGVEIYEGDIIEATERRYFLGHDKGLQTIRFKSQIVYEDAGFVYSTTQENDSPLFNTDEIVVIGNIYQNPELLTKKPLLKT